MTLFPAANPPVCYPPGAFNPYAVVGQVCAYGPSAASWWTPLHLTVVLCAGIAVVGLIALGVIAFRYRVPCRCSGWPHVPWRLRSRKSRAEARS